MGRRRGGNKLALKTGVVAKKQKTDEEVGAPRPPTPPGRGRGAAGGSCAHQPPFPLVSLQVLTSKGDAWAKYMAEVKKYKAHQCSDDDKTRPLVK